MNTAISEAIIAKLDPNIPGIEDIKVSSAAVAQLLMTDIAMKGPNALEDVKKDYSFVKALDSAYEGSQKYKSFVVELNEKVSQEEKQKQQNAKQTTLGK
ncbi:hypothetical protein BGZ46_007767 [Entomortierella lignicola]|nr:hypothetical protein BGZ46_007767 [Entomortierella lignicola]